MRKILFFIVALTLATPSFGQQHSLGIIIGYGATDFTDSPILLIPTTTVINAAAAKQANGYSEIGLHYYYHPIHALFRIKTGLSYCGKGNAINSLQYLRAPIGFDIITGTRLNFVLGGGLYNRFLVGSNSLLDEDFQSTKTFYQFGWEYNIGFGYTISGKYLITLVFQNNNDITKAYAAQQISHFGNGALINQKGIDGFISLGFTSFLPQQKAN